MGLITFAAALALLMAALPVWRWMAGAALSLARKGFAVRGRKAARKSESTANYGESHAISRHTVGGARATPPVRYPYNNREDYPCAFPHQP